MKIIGLLLVFLSTTAAGFFKAESYKVSERQLSSFMELIRFIKREISSYLTPQGRIYEKFSDKTLESIGFLPNLRKLSKENTDSPLLNSIEEFRSSLDIAKDAYERLCAFAQGLGTLSPVDECERCDRALEDLEEIYKKQKEETNEKTRLCRSVGSMVGVGLVLLLW